MSEQKMREALITAREVLVLEGYAEDNLAVVKIDEALAQREAQCATCGETEPRTGRCGTSDNDHKALCKRMPSSVKENEPMFPDEGKLWSFLRNVLSQGAAIQQDKGDHYERYSARLDAAAAERSTEFLALYAAPPSREALAQQPAEYCATKQEATELAKSMPDGATIIVGKQPAAGVELTDLELVEVIESLGHGSSRGLRKVCRAAIAAHEAKKNGGGA